MCDLGSILRSIIHPITSQKAELSKKFAIISSHLAGLQRATEPGERDL